MLATLNNFNYHRKLIEALLKARMAALATNVIAPVLFLIVFDMLPNTVLYVWTVLHFIVFILRMSIGESLLVNLDKYDDERVKSELKKYLFVLLLSSILWGAMTSMVVLYTDDLHIFIMISILIGIVSGAVSTVGSVYHAIFIYITVILTPFIFSLLYFGDTVLDYSTSLFLMVYFFVLLSSSFRNYKVLEDNVCQREKIELLNKSLEKEVQLAVRETQRKEKLIREQSRLAQMGEMISLIAHQWRQPLGTINSLVLDTQIKLALNSFDLQEKDGREKFLKYLDTKNKTIIKHIQFMSNTINDFRNFFKPDKEKEELPLTTSINRALQIVETSMKSKGVKVYKDFQTNDKVVLHHNEMTQVVLNILKNAQDNFLEKNIRYATVNISTYKKDDNYFITIEDNGGGIPEEILPKIFDPYFSTKDEKNGTGLGLYMSKTIIEEHNNGTLSAHNSKNGAIFEIVLKQK